MDPSGASKDYTEAPQPAPMARVTGTRTFVRHEDRGNTRASTTLSFPEGRIESLVLSHRTGRFRLAGQRWRRAKSSHRSRHRWRQGDRVCRIEEPHETNCRSET